MNSNEVFLQQQYFLMKHKYVKQMWNAKILINDLLITKHNPNTYIETFKEKSAFRQIPIGTNREMIFFKKRRTWNKTSCKKVYNSTLFDSTVREIVEG